MWKQLLRTRDKALILCDGVDNLKNLINSCCRNSKIKLSALYYALSLAIGNVPCFKTVWENLIISKHSFISWLAVQDCLLTQDKLLRRGIITTNVCNLCSGAGMESRDHLFFDCSFSCRVWNSIMEWLKFKWRSANCAHIMFWFSSRLRGNGFKQRLKRLAFTATIYNIWCERNERISQQMKFVVFMNFCILS
ncbi:uncharacterized protein LOC109846050 [Asparagus officinalis]|uniref:uncharacterized protein LOC109846050 n=1 Tax=Asparagus officinalis TaxID=4686 RepID=UPI00098E25E0|nr:uncharacterized protein LOC109846050 [Asparagus officinalis]